MRRLAILGASGHGKVVAEIAELNGWNSIEFFDDAWPEKKSLEHWLIIGNTETLISRISEFEGAIVAIGNNSIRLDKTRILINKGFNLPVLIHPKAVISNYAMLSSGTVVMAGAVINSFVETGFSCIINTNATVDHDCKLGDSVHICPGVNIAGDVVIGERSWIGIGSSVRQCIGIGKDVTVGAGAVVIKDIKDGNTVVGIPAKPI